MLEMSPTLDTQSGLMSWPRAEPKGGRAEDERLGEADDDGAAHGVAVVAAGAALAAGVADPVAEQHEQGRGEDGDARGAVQRDDGGDGGDDKGEEEGDADPVDVVVGDAVVGGGFVGHGRV
ncbi:hypothetical protein PWT90_10344 [Aphanocladium album]|nr:hypothetical protein PWT90_10344 [Aphanocladium album]